MAVMRRPSTRGSGLIPERAGTASGHVMTLAEELPAKEIDEALVG